MNYSISLIILIAAVAGIVASILSVQRKKKLLLLKLAEPFPHTWRDILQKKVVFYQGLEESEQVNFEERVRLFLATKHIEGVEVELDKTIRVLVAASAIIPTFAFPGYNYPVVGTVLIYPNSFDEEFRTKRYKGHREFISGMVGNRSMNGVVILSKPDLLADFNGLPNEHNVGIHEFVHMLDKEDGEIDGLPHMLVKQPFVGPWLHEIKKEMIKIEKGHSDINPYSLKNNAEFLAVVSEYFFENPKKFRKNHLELYQFLATIFKRDNNFRGIHPGKYILQTAGVFSNIAD